MYSLTTALYLSYRMTFYLWVKLYMNNNMLQVFV